MNAHLFNLLRQRGPARGSPRRPLGRCAARSHPRAVVARGLFKHFQACRQRHEPPDPPVVSTRARPRRAAQAPVRLRAAPPRRPTPARTPLLPGRQVPGEPRSGEHKFTPGPSRATARLRRAAAPCALPPACPGRSPVSAPPSPQPPGVTSSSSLNDLFKRGFSKFVPTWKCFILNTGCNSFASTKE